MFDTDLIGPFPRDKLRLQAAIETPFQILQSVTSVNAALLNIEGKLGFIAREAFADLLAIYSNSHENIIILAVESNVIAQIELRGRHIRISRSPFSTRKVVN